MTSIDSDGTHGGYDLELLRAICEAVRVPVIASGGAGRPADITAALETGASAALAASIFHDGTYPDPRGETGGGGMRPADQDLTLEPGQLVTCVVQDAATAATC